MSHLARAVRRWEVDVAAATSTKKSRAHFYNNRLNEAEKHVDRALYSAYQRLQNEQRDNYGSPEAQAAAVEVANLKRAKDEIETVRVQILSDLGG